MLKSNHYLFVYSFSGAGKTSLMNILSQRVSCKYGTLTVNSLSNNKTALKFLKRNSAYVEQDDVFLRNISVREALIYGAMLRLPSSVSIKDKLKMVELVMEEVDITKCANTKIGSNGFSKGISGGERKRLSIAMELLSNPSVLFLDEPTSGLDASTALTMIKLIKKLASNGRSIIITIHQPRSDIVAQFDKVLLLARGNVAYFGKASQVTTYFKSIGYKCPMHYNMADFAIDLVSETIDMNCKDLVDKRITHILDSYSKFEESKASGSTLFNLNGQASTSSNPTMVSVLSLIHI